MAGDEEWLDIDEAARYVNLPNRTIRRRISAGDFEAVGSPARIRRDNLDDFIDRSRIKPGELVHLNAYPDGQHRAGIAPFTSKGRPDRRFGPRYSAASDVAPGRLTPGPIYGRRSAPGRHGHAGRGPAMSTA